MTVQETAQIMEILRVAYPNFYNNFSDAEKIAAIQLWASMFERDPVETVIAAVKAHISADKRGFPPVIGQIKAQINTLTTPNQLSEMEAWSYVKRAVRNALYNAKAEYDKLPPTIKRVIGSHNTLREWAVIDTERFDTVVQSNFMRSYKAIAAKEQDYIALPQSVKDFSKQFALDGQRDRLIE